MQKRAERTVKVLFNILLYQCFQLSVLTFRNLLLLLFSWFAEIYKMIAVAQGKIPWVLLFTIEIIFHRLFTLLSAISNFNMIESLMLDAICYKEIITFTNRFGTTEFRQLPHGRWPLLKTELNILRTLGYKVKLCKHVKLYSGEQRFIAWKFCLRYKCKLHIG